VSQQGDEFRLSTEREAGAGLVGHQESFDHFSLNDVPLHDFLHVRLGRHAIPDSFGIDHHGRALCAIIETAGFVGTDDAFQVESFGLLLEAGVERIGAELGAAAARSSGSRLLVQTKMCR
jgi:hypothetical protein